MNKSLFLVLVVALVALSVDAKKKKPPVFVDGGDAFSDQHHFQDGQHDPKYDQDAFLGEDQAKSMSDLTPKQIKEKLR